MKKLISALVLLAIVIISGGCADSPSVDDTYSSSTENTSETQSQSFTGPMIEFFGAENEEGVSFSEAFYDNPIDKAYNTPVEHHQTTGDMINHGYKFRDYWEAEIDAVIVRLLTVLNETEANSLKNAQQAWSEYMENNKNFRCSALSHRGWQSDRIMIGTMLMNEARTRAMELMEIYYTITGELEFVFKGDTRIE